MKLSSIFNKINDELPILRWMAKALNMFKSNKTNLMKLIENHDDEKLLDDLLLFSFTMVSNFVAKFNHFLESKISLNESNPLYFIIIVISI